MEDEIREVYFDQYCKTCEYWETPEEKDPCHYCLAEPSNRESHKPVYYKEKEK